MTRIVIIVFLAWSIVLGASAYAFGTWVERNSTLATPCCIGPPRSALLRWKCMACSKVFSTPKSAIHRQRNSHKKKLIFKLLVNREQDAAEADLRSRRDRA